MSISKETHTPTPLGHPAPISSISISTLLPSTLRAFCLRDLNAKLSQQYVVHDHIQHSTILPGSAEIIVNNDTNNNTDKHDNYTKQ